MVISDFAQLFFIQSIVNIILIWFVWTSWFTMTKPEYVLLLIHFIVNSIFMLSVTNKWYGLVHIIHYFLPIYLTLCLLCFHSTFLLWLLVMCCVIMFVLFHMHNNLCIISKIINKTLCFESIIVKNALILMIFLLLLKITIKHKIKKIDF